MKVLLTGGAGYIGSNVLLALRDSGYETLILDNFCNSSEERLRAFGKLLGSNLNYVKSDIRSIEELRKVFSQHEIESVIHLAGLKSVSESIDNPNLYYENNVIGSKNLLSIMSEFAVNKLIFSSSATVYGNPNILPIAEEHQLKPMNNYGQTKLEVENLINKYSKIIDKSGKILKTEKWGLLNLSHKIKKNKKGIFVHFKMEAEGKIVKEVERQLSIDNNIIRYLTVKYDELDLKNEYFGSKK